ncbi:lytic transglycosylase domain-containing protein [Curvibacter sp. CHRR-16]|nr:lytic transglycosylase domain-containing protein [Curvibacter sp. CHRR-16]
MRFKGLTLLRQLLAVTHNGFALLGLSVLLSGSVVLFQPEVRAQVMNVASQLMGASTDNSSAVVADLQAADRATATSPRSLPKQQAALAQWLSKRYNVAPEPISALVSEAYAVGNRQNMNPTLILAVMAIESGFNPFAQSHVGAQGLMQVMTKVHSDKYDQYGGKLAAFDPLANVRVGAQVLNECIRREGSIEGGLKCYVGASSMDNDGGYSAKVLSMQAKLDSVATGRPVPTSETAAATSKANETLLTMADEGHLLR